MKRLVMITGGARSGKSSFAQQVAQRLGRRVAFVATAVAGDGEMARRIDEHRARRPASWATIEAPELLGGVLERAADAGDVLVVDCLTFWLANRLLASGVDPSTADLAVEVLWPKVEEFLRLARECGANVVVVTNEVGMGVVPATETGRAFRDIVGRANQALAAQADEVYLMVSGLPVKLKGA